MSTTAKTPSGTGVAPWRPLFLSHIEKMPSPEFVFTSLHPAPPGSSVPYVPRARYCVFRGMWGELPENKHYDPSWPKNERVYESDMLTLTTDVRMAKVPEIFASSKGHGTEDQSQGSGGGGPVEAVFWVKGEMTQWRVRGEAYVVAEDIEGAHGEEESSGVRTVKSRVGERMRVVREEGKESWSWGTELTAHFGNLAPGMRGSFKVCLFILCGHGNCILPRFSHFHGPSSCDVNFTDRAESHPWQLGVNPTRGSILVIRSAS
jgi:pyridoxamine 5'-phosphate oxidase